MYTLYKYYPPLLRLESGKILPHFKSKVLVVVPVFNEAGHLEESCREIRRFLPEGHHLILVDDRSTDASWEVLKGIAGAYPHTTSTIRLSRNFGKEDAVCAGLDRALQICRSLAAEMPKCVIVMDADLQHPPEVIPRMIKLWARGFKVVEARKEQEKKTFLHSFLTRVYLQMFRGMTGVDLEGASDFKLLDQQVLQAWKSLEEGNPFFRGIVAWMGFEKAAVTFQPPCRVEGESKWSFRSLVDLGISSIINFSALPLQLVTLTGVIFFVFAILLGVQTLYEKIAGSAVDGFTTVIILQLIIGGSLMFSLGIMGTYLGKIHQGIKRRPRYLVEEGS